MKTSQMMTMLENDSENDIKTVWNAKALLGFSHPVSIEEGTGSMLNKITI